MAEGGHTIGSHTWSHAALGRKNISPDQAKEEIEKGIAAVNLTLGAEAAPFFRFVALQHPPELVTYLGERNIAIFSTDMDSFDFKARRPEQVVNAVMNKLKKQGKGIVLMHDLQHNTADALPELLKQLKDGGYKIVHMRAKGTVKSMAKYDDMLKKEAKLPTVDQRPTASVVRTVE
jgi:peptidoglycan/xylan/chitin deacetylase (PgdA/CDA1 family)